MKEGDGGASRPPAKALELCEPLEPQASPSPGVRSADVSIQVSCPSCCQDWGCGANTATVDNRLLNPIRFDGADAGSEHFRLLSDSFVFATGERGKITVKDGEFVVNGGVKGCDRLTGSQFEVERGGTITTVTITRMGQVKLFPDWERDDGEARFVTAYELGYDGPEGSTDCLTGVCPFAHAWSHGGQLREGCGPEGEDDCAPAGKDRVGHCEELSLDAITYGRFAVLVQGETYNGPVGKIDRSGADGAPWFDIACSGSALSKMILMNYNPTGRYGSTTRDQRQATLNMITARYCPGRTSFTESGTPLEWQNAEGAFAAPSGGFSPTKLEARWDKDGATCLDTRRNPTAGSTSAIAAACRSAVPPLPAPPTCDRPSRPGWEWESYIP